MVRSPAEGIYALLDDILWDDFLPVKAFFHSAGHLLILRVEMIRCYLSRLMGEHKMKIVDVARATGLHRNTITLLYQEKAERIDIEAIEKLCVLFKCSVADLFEYVPEK